MSNSSDYDKDMNEKIQSAMHAYFDGSVSYEEALSNFYSSILEIYPDLKR